MLGDEYKNLSPEERERMMKENHIRNHYVVDVRAGDLVKYKFAGVEFVGLVREVDKRESNGIGDLTGMIKTYAKVIWSSTSPDKKSEKEKEESAWYELNKTCWTVANR